MKRPAPPVATPATARRRLPTRALAWLALALPAACSSGVPADAGFKEPLLVHDAQFLSGALPGSAPIDGGSAAPSAGGEAPAGPAVTLVEATSRVVFPGEGGKVFSGRASPDARSIALALTDLGTGYWVAPVGGPDPQAGGELTWQIGCDFAERLPPGPHTLRFVAIDDRGVAGAWRDLALCVTSGAPDDLSACDPAAAPPPAVLSLEWDRDVDLDLEVVTPSGRRIGPKRPSTSAPGGAPPTGAIERDARRDCALNGARREDLVWNAKPEPGLYLVYANLFDACGEAAVRFRASLSISETSPEGPSRLVERLERAGVLTAIDANGGAGPGLFVAEFVFQLPEKETHTVLVERLLRFALLGSSWVLYLLLALSVASFASAFERFRFFRRHRDDLNALSRRVHAALLDDDFDAADTTLAASPSIEARIVRSALRWKSGGPGAVADVVDSELGRERAELERGLTLLGTLGNNAPFVGLLGTVLGVIEAFHHLGGGQSKEAMGNVMAGIAEALVATGVGLFVALPAVVAYNLAQKRIGDIEAGVTSLGKLVTASLKSRERGEGA